VTATGISRAAFGVTCAVLVTLAVGGCAQRHAVGPAVPRKPKTLQERLEDYRIQRRQLLGPQRAKIREDYLAAVRASGIAARALHVGDKAPAFELPNAWDELVSLQDLLRQGPVVLLWYWGGWDPYSMIELRAYEEALSQIQGAGATLVAISPQNVEHTLETQQLGQFAFESLSDAGNRVARRFGLAHKLTPAFVKDLRATADPRVATDLREYNGDDSGEMPLAATYVIDREGVIRYAFVDPDYRKRAEPADVLAVLKEISAGPPEPAAASRGVRLYYDLALLPPAERRVDVVARIDGLDPACAALPLEMSQDWAFVRLREPLLGGPLQAMAGGQPLAVERTGPYAWTIKPASHTSVELRYSVPLTHRELQAVRDRHDEFEYPFVADEYALLPTAALLACPAGLRADEIRVRLNVPAGWDIRAPWRRLPDGEFAPEDCAALANDLLALGHWDSREIRMGDFVGTIVFAPGQEEIEDAAAGVIRRIVEHELALFGRSGQGQYLFLFGPPAQRGMMGSPKTNSMVLAVDPQMHERGVRHLSHLVAHEFFHTWAHSIGELPDELRWLNEGVTDYYAYLVSARLGYLTWEEFAATLAENMLTATNDRYFGGMSLVEAGGPAFFTDASAYDLVYAGGMVWGAWLDRAIRAEGQGKSLDDFMRALLNDSRWSRGGNGPHVADVVNVLPCFVSADLARQAEDAVCQPYRFDPVAAFAALGVTVTPQTDATKLELRANFDGTRVSNVDHKDLAYRIGVREEDRLSEVNGQPVANAAQVHRAWRSPQDGRVRVTLERGGARIDLDEPLPAVLGYEVAAEPWRTHLADSVVLANDVVAGEDK
jgi:predicted metalloprotease with PDZ domain/peroxiredoxin